MVKDPAGSALVSIRSWREYIGSVSGYNYIPVAGEIEGAVWGDCGSDAYSMQVTDRLCACFISSSTSECLRSHGASRFIATLMTRCAIQVRFKRCGTR